MTTPSQYHRTLPGNDIAPNEYFYLATTPEAVADDAVAKRDRQETVYNLLDRHYDRGGLTEFTPQQLQDAAADIGIPADRDHLTVIMPRQLPGSTLKHRGQRLIGSLAAERLMEETTADSYSVLGLGLQQDQMYSAGPEKRSYAFWPLLTSDGVREVDVTAPRDGRSLQSHDVDLSDDDRDTLETYRDCPGEAGTLPELLSSDSAALYDRRADFGDLQQDVLIPELHRHGEYPDLKIEQDDGRVVPARYEGRLHRYVNEDEGVALRPSEAADRSILQADDFYQYGVYPIALLPNTIWTLMDVEGKLYPGPAHELRAEVAAETGIEDFSIATMGHPSLAVDRGSHLAPRKTLYELANTSYGAVAESWRDDDTLVLGARPAGDYADRIDAVENDILQNWDGGDNMDAVAEFIGGVIQDGDTDGRTAR